MGIPAYFSYIIKNYPNILQKINKDFIVENLFLDSNSIIYDSFRDIEYENDVNDYEKKIIHSVCKKIENYIKDIRPSNLVYIAFDGVAPIAKLNQQKNRRYKSSFMNSYNNNKNQWDSTCITPGTEFMNKLNLQIKYFFRNSAYFKVKNIIIDGSDNPGEGEHKIFDYIRDNTQYLDTHKSVIYGLDADLIMLTINNLSYCQNMFLFRETPSFIKNIDKSLDPNCLYMINIPEFKNQLVYYLNNDKVPENEQQENKLYDYIFLCFFLGNDFLPHFPSLNIRTSGMDILMETYRNILKNKNIIVDGKIKWKNVRLLIAELAKNENENIQYEYKIRNKQEKRPQIVDENASKFDKEMLHCPIVEREIEKYINPFDDYWENRYYDMLFDIEIDDNHRKEISINYLEGLEWTWKYYSTGCCDWRWSYKYHYPPLLKDLIRFVPYFDGDLIEPKNKDPIHEHVQLSYVLPRKSLYLLPHKIKNKLLEEYQQYYKDDYEFLWSFCKYFWECHVVFPILEIKQLEKIIEI